MVSDFRPFWCWFKTCGVSAQSYNIIFQHYSIISFTVLYIFFIYKKKKNIYIFIYLFHTTHWSPNLCGGLIQILRRFAFSGLFKGIGPRVTWITVGGFIFFGASGPRSRKSSNKHAIPDPSGFFFGVGMEHKSKPEISGPRAESEVVMVMQSSSFQVRGSTEDTCL